MKDFGAVQICLDVWSSAGFLCVSIARKRREAFKLSVLLLVLSSTYSN